MKFMEKKQSNFFSRIFIICLTLIGLYCFVTLVFCKFDIECAYQSIANTLGIPEVYKMVRAKE